MPASQTGFGNFFLERNLSSMPTGYQIPVLVQQQHAQQQQQQAQQHLAAMAAAGVPITYSGLQGYNFIPYPHHRHIAHMNNGFDLKAASPYHHALLARGGAFYPPYRPAAAVEDLSARAAAVTKVATRESTGALKAWLNEHLKNPYPTKGEKIMLAIITKMSLTQVSTWFANARRRLKKENRVSWASKGKSDEEEEEEDEDEEEREGESDDERSEIEPENESERVGGGGDEQRVHLETSSSSEPDVNARLEMEEMQEQPHEEDAELALVRKVEKRDSDSESKDKDKVKDKDNISSQKPKIWSLAETATSEPVRRRKSPADSVFLPAAAGGLWADWASRGGLLLPACYTTREII